MSTGIERSAEDIIQDISAVEGSEPLLSAFRSLIIPGQKVYPLRDAAGVASAFQGDRHTTMSLRLDPEIKEQTLFELYRLMPHLLVGGERPFFTVRSTAPAIGLYQVVVEPYEFFPNRGYIRHVSDLVIEAQKTVGKYIDRYLGRNF